MRRALSNFEAALDNVRFVTFDIDAGAAMALSDAVALARHNTIQGAVTVTLTGFLESFIKNLAEAFVTALCAKQVAFTSLPTEIQSAHFSEGGAVLSNRAQNKGKARWVMASPADLARRLDSSRTNLPYEMVWEAFAETGANPGSVIIGSFLKRFGILHPWDRIESKTSGNTLIGPRVSKGTLITQLDSLLAVRNECAHNGSPAIIPSPSQIRGYCDLIQVIGTAIVEVLEDQLLTV